MMRRTIWLAAVAIASSSIGPAGAQPDLIDPCDGPVEQPAAGTPEWRVREAVNAFCSEQRKIDAAEHPVMALPAPALGGGSLSAAWNDDYRHPSRHDNIRFRYASLSISGNQSEVYMPCPTDPTVCPGLPEGLQRFDPPYPAILVFHGLASRRELHWWSSQTLAEAGYLVVTMNGAPYPNAPNAGNAQTLMDWLLAGQGLAANVDTARIGVTGHSLGGNLTTSFQGDDRVSALVAWDGGTSVSTNLDNLTPELFLRADYNGWPGYPDTYTSQPNPVRAAGFATLRDKDVDTMVVTIRGSTHLDWTGGPLMGNRYAELVSVYYTIAWFDRYLRGLVVGGESAGEAADRAAIADDAFARLIADTFDDSADRHNISQGFWDPVQAALSGDLLYGGNVPYAVAGKPIEDRLSFYYYSSCFLTDPGSGNRADALDMRATGCKVV